MKHSIKLNRAHEEYTGFKGAETYTTVEKQLPEELIEKLTGKQLALVMQAISKAYQSGKASAGAEMIDNNAVYINRLGKVIEWSEEGAEYEYQKVVHPAKSYKGENGKDVYIPESTSMAPVKVKDGILVPRFSE